MAFAAGTIFHGWSSGATDQGGGFDPTNANFLTDLTTDTNTGNTTSPVVSSASYNFVAGDVGAWLFIQSGTNWIPGWYQIASVASNKATLTGTIGAGVKYGTDSLNYRTYHRPNGVTTAAGVASVATPTGGVWSIDYSQQTGAFLSYTDIVIDGTTNTDATSAAHPFGKQMLGNIINVASGTGFTVQLVQLTSIPSGVIGRFDKSLGTLSSTGGTGKMGGAIGSSSAITALTLPLVAGNKVYLKGTYTLTATTTVTAAIKGDITDGRISVEGFTTTPGQLDGRPTITSATNSVALFTLNDNDFTEWIHLSLTHTAATRGNGFACATANTNSAFCLDIIFDGCLIGWNGANQNALGVFIGCEFKNCTSTTAAISFTAASSCWMYGCDVHDNAGDGVRAATSNFALTAYRTIFDTNAGIHINYTTSTTANLIVDHCTFVDGTSDAIKFAATASTSPNLYLSNTVFWGNGGADINNLDEQMTIDVNCRVNRNNAYGNNTNPRVGFSYGLGDVSLSATDPFTNRSGRDFSPNSTAGGGALLRATSYPGAFPGGASTNYADIGAVQHQESAASGSGSTGNFFPGGNVTF